MGGQIDFIETDAGWIYDMVISKLEENVKEPLYPGDERRIYGEGFSAVVAALFHYMNDKCRQSLLRYARGVVLDAMGERVLCPRHGPSCARVETLRFFVMHPLTRNAVIPLGTKATPDNTVYFETTAPAVLSAGSLFVDVTAQCTVGGTVGNGYRSGSITTMVDLVPLIGGVTNIEESHGGDDGEPYDEEGDKRYRERIRLAPASFSTAGSEAAYKHWVFSADAGIRDVAVVSDHEAGTIDIVVLMNNGQGPDEEVTEKILSVVNDKKIRAMNDLLSVQPPEFPVYDIRIKYYITSETEAAAIQAVEGVGGAVDRYKEWQDGAMGRDVNPDKLRALILCPNWEEGLTGALRVDIAAPQHRKLDRRQVARFSGRVTVEREVVEE